MYASILLLPAFVLGGWDWGDGTPEFDVSAGAAPAARTSTWVDPARIVDEPVEIALPARSTSTTAPAVRPATTSTTAPERATESVAPTTTTTTTIPPSTTAPSTTAPPRTTTTVAAVTTTTSRPLVALPALSPVSPAAKHAHTEHGVASWYNAPDRTCAHRTAPKGTVIHVTRTSTGESTTCTVADWGPADRTRIIDLSMDTFELLAHASTGLIDVVTEW